MHKPHRKIIVETPIWNPFRRTRNKNPEDLSVEEIRFLLVDKRRASRNIRLDRFRKTGRVMSFVGESELLADSGNRSSGQTKIRDTKTSHRTWLDVLLLGMEILAVVGLIAIAANSLFVLGTLNRNVAAAFRQPALEPTPIVREVVLPEGHTPPNSPGGARPNEAEIPPHLRPLIQSIANLPIPTPGSQQAIRIQIPAINVDSPVVQEVFRYLEQLKPGDVVILFTSQRQYIYVITGAQLVAPTAVEVMDPTSDARITLISCHPYLVDIHRIVVSAVLQNP